MKMACLRFGWIGVALLTLLVAPGSQRVALGNVYKSRVNVRWAEDGSHCWYRNDLSKGRREFVLVDLGEGVRKAAFDHGRVAKALEGVGIAGVEGDRLPIDDLGFDLGKSAAFFRVKGRHFQLELESHKLAELERA